MISLLEIAKSINEVDDDKIIKYKDKDGESQEMTAGAAKKQPDEHPAKIAYNRMKDSDGGEKDSGGKLGGSDFDRDANRAADDEADDMDRDARFAADAEDDDKGYVPPSERDYDVDDAEFAEKYGYDVDATVNAFDDEEMEDIIDKMADDAGVSVDNPIELVKIVRNKDEYGNANLGDIHKHINDMAGKPKGDDDNAESDDKNAPEKENEKIEKELQNIAKDKGLTVGSEDANYGGEIHSLVGKDDDPDNTLGFHAAPNFDDDGNMTDEPQYAIELGMGTSPMYFGSKEEADAALQKIVDDERIRKAMDGEGGETLFDLGDHAKSILKGKDETIYVYLK